MKIDAEMEDGWSGSDSQLSPRAIWTHSRDLHEQQISPWILGNIITITCKLILTEKQIFLNHFISEYLHTHSSLLEPMLICPHYSLSNLWGWESILVISVSLMQYSTNPGPEWVQRICSLHLSHLTVGLWGGCCSKWILLGLGSYSRWHAGGGF